MTNKESQVNKIVNQTKQPAKNLINTVNKIDMIKENPRQIAKRGHPVLRSEKYSCKLETFIYLLKSNSYIIYGGG